MITYRLLDCNFMARIAILTKIFLTKVVKICFSTYFDQFLDGVVFNALIHNLHRHIIYMYCYMPMIIYHFVYTIVRKQKYTVYTVEVPLRIFHIYFQIST